MIAAHADWSVDPRKRWISLAVRRGEQWRVFAPAPVGRVDDLLSRLHSIANGGSDVRASIVLGLDLPIGLPRAYAERHATEADFPAFLRGLRNRPRFFEVCSQIGEVCGDRPFYPRQSRAGTKLAAHVAALGFETSAQMSRLCDRKTADRPAGASLFWTLGANQVGKGALNAWRELLLPCLADSQPASLWPFDGPLADLVMRGGMVLAETYPAEAMRQLGLKLVGSKRRQADRATLGSGLRGAIARLGGAMEAGLGDAIDDGFGAKADGEDRFDSLLGLLCVMNVLSGARPDSIPADPWITRWEGWVLGQAVPLPQG